jgi:hypothetical protein
MGSEIQEVGFGQGFSKEVEAILAVADRGILYPREIRENLQKAGFLIYEDIQMPDVAPPAVDELTADEVAMLEQFMQEQQAQDTTENTDEEQEL